MNIRRVLAHPAFLLRATVRTVGLLAATLVTAFFLACSSGNETGGTSAPTILAQPQGLYIQTGKSFSLTVTATSKPASTFQWQKGGTPIAGATQATYTVAAAAAADTGSYTVKVTNGQGSVTSDAATVTVLDAPAITADPVAVTTGAGMGATLQVTATGGAPLSYQWMRDGQAVNGATSATYTIAAAAPANAGTYTVVVNNPVGVATSKPATLTVVPPLVVTAPASAAIIDGATVSFSVTPTGLAPYTFQWLKNGAAITGANASTYAIPVALWAAENGAKYACTVTDALNRTVTTAFATVTVTPIAPAVTADPVDLSLMAGEPATFTVGISGTLPIAYQWYNGSTPIAGATSNTLALAAVSKADEGLYWVKATNAAGTVSTKYAKLTVSPLLSVSGPADKSVNDGATATFSVVATGVAPYSYQWYRGATLITGAQSASYTTPAAVWATDNGAQFTCKVSDSLSRTVTSSAATLVVVPVAPAITAQPADKTVLAGVPAAFSVTATGTAPLGYQWYLKGAAVSGATSSSWTLNSPAVADSGSVYVVVSNGAGQTVTSGTVTLTVDAQPVPVITVQPASKTVTAPDGATFSVTATGAQSYQWYRNAAVITGATNASYTVAATDLRATADVYTVDVTNAAGTTPSDPATLTVKAPIPVYAGDPLKPTALALSNWFVEASYNLTAPVDPVLGSFRVGYDLTKQNPLWSAACFFPSVQVSNASRPGSYPQDPRVAGSPDETQYNGTGWSRGHQTPYADLRDRYGADAGYSTMYMTNMVPQDQTLNGGPWVKLETQVNTTWPGTYGRVWVYTGPIFGDTIYHPLGTSNIPVPNAFYKIVVRETAPGSPKVLAMIVPNSSTIGKPGVVMANTDFWKFTTTVDRVQELTGLTFFPNPSSPLPVSFTSTVDVAGWGAPVEQGPGKPNVHIIEPSWDSQYKHTHNNTNAVLIINRNTAMVNVPVNFRGLATADPDAIVSTTWDFGDGATSNVANTTHTYTTAGDYTVKFTALDAAGHTNFLTRAVTIGSTTNAAPVFVPATLPNVTVGNGAKGMALFTFNDDRTVASDMQVTATSSNATLIPDANLSVIWDDGSFRWVVYLTPVAGQDGSATITVNATDKDGATTSAQFTFTVKPASEHYLSEPFEYSQRTSTYTPAGDVVLPSGTWTFTDALCGNLAADVKNGLFGVRMRNATSGTASGKLTMKADYPYGVATVTVAYARYGTDAATGTFGLFYSTDQGANWTQAGSTVAITNTTTSNTATFTINQPGPIRFEIRRMDTTTVRVNFDDFTIIGS